MAEVTHMRRTLTIGASPDEVFTRWREPSVLPRVMGHFAEVQPQGPDRAHWSARLGDGEKLEWSTEVVEADAGARRLRWTSTDEPQVSTGELVVREAPNGLGSEVTLDLTLAPDGAPVASVVTSITEPVAEALAATALRRFKSLVETGEIPTLDRNPAAHGQTGQEPH
jgi:uncharacterized membrane protein